MFSKNSKPFWKHVFPNLICPCFFTSSYRPQGRQDCWLCVSILRDWYQAGWDLVNISWSQNFMLKLQTFFFWKIMLIFNFNTQTYFCCKWILQFWPTDKFQENILASRRVSKNQYTAMFPISLANKFKSEMWKN